MARWKSFLDLERIGPEGLEFDPIVRNRERSTPDQCLSRKLAPMRADMSLADRLPVMEMILRQ